MNMNIMNTPNNNEEYKNKYKPTLLECADNLKSRFNDRFYKYINELVGEEFVRSRSR
jgi:hypothetical protein